LAQGRFYPALFFLPPWSGLCNLDLAVQPGTAMTANGDKTPTPPIFGSAGFLFVKAPAIG